MRNNQFRTGWVVVSNSFYPLLSTLLFTWRSGVWCHFSMSKNVEGFANLVHSPWPHVVLFGLVLCSFFYWAEHFYVANVVKVFFINVFCILLTWFCLLQIKAAMGCSHSEFDPHGICASLPSKRSSGNAVPHAFR